jgi:hypothetical protein
VITGVTSASTSAAHLSHRATIGPSESLTRSGAAQAGHGTRAYHRPRRLKTQEAAAHGGGKYWGVFITSLRRSPAASMATSWCGEMHGAPRWACRRACIPPEARSRSRAPVPSAHASRAHRMSPRRSPHTETRREQLALSKPRRSKRRARTLAVLIAIGHALRMRGRARAWVVAVVSMVREQHRQRCWRWGSGWAVAIPALVPP